MARIECGGLLDADIQLSESKRITTEPSTHGVSLELILSDSPGRLAIASTVL